MQKKILSLILTLGMVVCLTACDSTNTSVSSVSGPEVTVASESVEEVKPSLVLRDEPQEVEEGNLEYALALRMTDNRSVSLLDSNDKLIDTIVMPEGSGTIVGVTGNYILTEHYEWNEYAGESVETLNAYDFVTGETKTFASYGTSVDVDVYNGIIYASHYEYETGHTYEDAYDGKTLKPVSSMQDFLDGMVEYTLQGRAFFGRDAYRVASVQRIVDACGFCVVFPNAPYDHSMGYKYDGTNFTEFALPENTYTIPAYTDSFFFAEVYRNGDFDKTDLYSCDYNGQFYLLDEDIYSVLGFKDGVLYWAKEDSYNFGVEPFTISGYNLNNGETVEIAVVQKHPGMDDIFVPGVSGFTIGETGIYFLADDREKTGWYKASLNSNYAYETKSLDITVKEYEVFDYGTVGYLNDTICCPYCGEKVVQVYREFFQVNEDITPQAEAINDYLFQDAGFALDASKDSSYIPTDDSSCEEHGHYYTLETDETGVSQVFFLGDSYMVIDMDGYWYGGGAHGYPTNFQYLFDLQTGKEVSFLDFYNGTEEELKTLAATKAKEDCEKSVQEDGYSMYYTDDPDSVYSDAYEYVTLDNNHMVFGKECMFLTFPPYEIGPYASGYIIVEISYEELGISF